MLIDDDIIIKYLSGQNPDSYKNSWIYSSVGREYMFEIPNPSNVEWVLKLYEKLKKQIRDFKPCNYELIKKLFPNFDDVVRDYTIMFVVGFPDPYDAMVLKHDNTEYMVFDLIQFGQDSLDESYSCHRVLTHELLHICLRKKRPEISGLSYVNDLNYMMFDEGFAHALSYSENICDFKFDDFLKDKYERSRAALKRSVIETDIEKQKACRVSADTGDYWDKFGSISGMLYILKNLNSIVEIYNNGWKDFSDKIINDTDC